MKITVYELIGLVKENKQPNKIKYKGQEYTFFKDDEITDYYFKYNSGIDDWLSTHIGNEYISDMFINTVEIIEEPKKIEKEALFKLDKSMSKDSLVAWQKANNGILKKKIDELIDEINKLKEE